MNIFAQAVTQAKKSGVELGKAQKQILGPVASGKAAGSAGKIGKLSKEEYLKLSPDEKIKYNKREQGLT